MSSSKPIHTHYMLTVFTAWLLMVAAPSAYAADTGAVPLLGSSEPPANTMSAGNESLPEKAPPLPADRTLPIGSLFFSDADIARIHAAMQAYLSGRGNFLDNVLPGTSGITGAPAVAPEKQSYTYPQFFLDSLVYDTPESWIVWINSHKITQSTPQEHSDIAVYDIDQDKVVVKWRPGNMKKVMEVWQKARNEHVDVDTLHNTVTFTLRPNQTFTSYLMRVVEGKATPVTEEPAIPAAPGAAEAAPEAPNAAPAPELLTEDEKAPQKNLNELMQTLYPESKTQDAPDTQQEAAP